MEAASRVLYTLLRFNMVMLEISPVAVREYIPQPEYSHKILHLRWYISSIPLVAMVYVCIYTMHSTIA